ncbi:MAG: class I SAM-dependent methyltransferase [Candidatus Dactylopiibacterium sp.]|nr:class I SAM-dependent methyltransferase [Candidatus Dactylopiibacterium sp.]
MSNGDPLLQEAYDFFAKGQYIEAYRLFLLIESRTGSSAELANDMGVTLFKAGLTDKALEHFRQAAGLDSQSLVAGNLFDVIDDQQQRIQALETARRSARPAPAAPGAFDALGQSLFARALEMWCADSAAALKESVRTLSDEEWFAQVIASVDSGLAGTHHMPRFAPAETQSVYVGSSGRSAMEEGARFMRFLLDVARRNGVALESNQVRVADFGSGWGRYTRFMLKYVHPDNLFGLEVQADMVERCRKEFGRANFVRVSPYPPTVLQEGLLDLVFGYSVFSHLAPACADAWIAEFARIVKPGGLVVMTTQGRDFIEFCRQKRVSGDLSHPWFRFLAQAFVDSEAAFADYDAGNILFAPTMSTPTYGEALVPRGYVERHWLDDFELLDFIDDRQVLPQAVFILRRRPYAQATGWRHHAAPAPLAAGQPPSPAGLLVTGDAGGAGAALVSALAASGRCDDLGECFSPARGSLAAGGDAFTHWRELRLQAQQAGRLPAARLDWADFAPLAGSGFDLAALDKTAVVHVRGDALEQALREHGASGAPWEVDALLARVEAVLAGQAAWREHFARRAIAPCIVEAAEIQADVAAVARRIAAHCGFQIDATALPATPAAPATTCPPGVLDALRRRLAAA